jgi:hypothetical protein
MKMLADTRGFKINGNDKKDLTDKFSTMPPHPRFRQRCASFVIPVSGCSASPTICLRCKPASSHMAASSIYSNNALAPTA